jgi:amino acid adenylation domain-containing protein
MARAVSIARKIFERAQAAPTDPALSIDGETWTYAELLGAAGALASRLPTPPARGPAPAVAIMAHRHASAYLGVLACLLRGCTYVPIGIDHPPRRNLAVLARSGARHVICGDLAAGDWARLVAEDEGAAGGIEAIAWPDRKTAPAPMPEAPAADIDASRRAYILFTSGSTGEPKGVPISHAALTGYLDAASALMPTGPGDRFSQTFELTFDLSVHDLLLCWTSGAHLVVAGRADLSRPAEYIRAHQLTRWFSVPSLAFQIRSQGDLSRDAFPSLRTSLFCGEALPWSLADEWAAAAPNGPVENWYGPTEATIACARFVLPPPGGVRPHDLVPIGEAFEGMALSVRGPDLRPLPDGEAGELFLSGRQLAEGYLNDPEKTAGAFVAIPGEAGASYRTGDRAVRDPGGPARFLGRVDNQVKVRGFRIELGEVEAALRDAAGGANAVALSWPPGEPSGRFIVAALEADTFDHAAVIAAVSQALPDYMAPAQVFGLGTFPVNASGKADRRAVAAEVAQRMAAAARSAAAVKLSAEQKRFMAAIRAVSPTLDPERVLSAPSLIAAGMDSLSFITLTAEMERLYRRNLSQDEVVELSTLSFDELLTALKRRSGQTPFGRTWGRLAKKLKRLFVRKEKQLSADEKLSHRTNRAVQFVHALPALLATADRPVVLAIGSSGVFRGLTPEHFEAEAAALGHAVLCINAGLPGLSATGLNRLCGWIRQVCEVAGVTLEAAIFELDPMHVSVIPARADLDLSEHFFTAEQPAFAEGELGPDFEWDGPSRGALRAVGAAAAPERRPNWERRRDREVARAFAGDVAFAPSAIAHWAEGLKDLAPVARRTFCFIHPADKAMLAELPERQRGLRFEALKAALAELQPMKCIAWEDFDLVPADFQDVNHVTPRAREKLSRQLARFVFAGT